MNVLLGLFAAYVVVGVMRCRAALPGTDYLPYNAAGTAKVGTGCDNNTLECYLKWPMWNSSKCNTHL
jgi:hypothetical protein